ncbi:MAG TPA: lysine--tRNA ligase [Granulicella sp.]
MYESEFEENLYNLRREKRRQIEGLGQQAYPNSFAFTHTIPAIRAEFDARTGEELEANRSTVAIAGRIMAIRLQGKAGFAQLQQGGQRLQIYVRKDDVGEEQFALYKLLDLGDHIGVRGFLMRTRTGELTVHAAPQEGQPAITFLAKAMLALPDKYHGLEDTEIRYRQRYVDLFMNTGNAAKPQSDPAQKPVILSEGEAAVEGPASGTPHTVSSSAAEEEVGDVREVFVKRAAVLRALRKFFDARGYLEVETPMLHTVAGGAAARPFETHHNALGMGLYLRIAPELFLKRLVVGGLDRVYEINRNFRNEGVSTRHNPEFTMLEFYQAYANYHDLMNLTEELIQFVAMEVNGSLICHFNGSEIDLGKWTRLSMKQAIIRFWYEGMPLKPSLESFQNVSTFRHFLEVNSSVGSRIPQSGDKEENLTFYLGAWCEAAVKRLDKGEPWGKIFAELFEILSDERLTEATIIYDFPLAVSPLSKQKPDEPEWVERFEFYIGGFEVGNAFSELNDPDEQYKRFADQLKERDRGDDEAHQMDEDYVRALGYGLPPTGGEGIGIDRLTMVLTGAKSIRDVILFPLMRPLNKPQQPEEPHAIPQDKPLK